MSEQQQQPIEAQVEEQVNDMPVTQGLVQPRLDTFDPVPESEAERESLIKELEDVDSLGEKQAPASEDAQP